MPKVFEIRPRAYIIHFAMAVEPEIVSQLPEGHNYLYALPLYAVKGQEEEILQAMSGR